MFLEKIKLFGFKAFATRAEIRLGSGITGILGPNGCGKSNVADAIRWVLGEQSVKQLRGAAMEDVIFKGTRDRKPMGMAEVQLTIDNRQGRLPVDYEQVSVGRRLYRSGVSEYLLNRTPCRLKDVRSVLLDSGLGVQAYSVFERLMIDEILNDSSPRRREMFEEASGIMKYKVRKKEAMRKLESSNRDLERLDDLINELDREVRSLARQVGRARRYLNLKTETRDLDVALSARRIATIEARREDLGRELESARAGEAGLGSELATAETATETLRQQALDVADGLSRARQSLAEEKDAVANRRQRREVLTERRAGLVRTIEALTGEIETEESRAALLDRELQVAREELSALSTRVSERESELRGEEAEAEGLSAALEERRTRHASLQALMLDLRETESAKRHDIARENVRLEEIARRIERLTSDRDALGTRREALGGKLAGRREELDGVEAALTAAREERAALAADRERAGADLESARAEENEATSALARVTSRLETLEELRRSHDGFDAGVRKILEEKRPGVVGALADVLEVDDALGLAVEAVLGASMQSIVVADADAAISALSILDRDATGRVTLCPAREMSRLAPPPASPPVGRSLASLVRVRDTAARGVVDALLARAFLVDDPRRAREAARAHPELTWVTPGGEVFHDDRRISGGGPTIGSKLLRRSREIHEMGIERERLERVLSSARARAEDATRRGGENTTAIDALDERIARTDTERAEVREAARHLEFEMNLAREEMRGLDAEITTLGGERNETSARLGGLESDCREAEAAGVMRSSELARLVADLTGLESEREKRLELVADRRVAFVEITAEQRAVEGRRERLANDREGAARSVEERRNRIAEADLQIGEIDAELETLGSALDGAKDAIEAATARVDGLVAEEAESRNTWTERDRSLRGLRERVGEAQKRVHGIELQLSGMRGETERTRERLMSEYGVELLDRMDAGGVPLVVRHERRRLPLGPGELPESPAASNGTPRGDDGADAEEPEANYREEIVVSEPLGAVAPEAYRELDLDAWEPIVKELREKLHAFGPVNEMAVEDHETKKARLEFLSRQRDDLVEARNALIETIRKVNREARERFLETFAKAQQHFKDLHEILFPGGHAELRLEGEDPLEADIVMEARPRGKRIESIKLLSSGERALTAIALLFSVYMIKPSPFCILDEVDAPLDDANIDRFVELIKTFSEKTQFIVITHNKRTMEACDVLYGVTMQEPGVSTLVAVRFHDGEILLDGKQRPDLVPS